jgi:glycosyltransferase involved in cell wall biosynthesis
VPDGVSLVLPTRNRAAALRIVLPELLRVRGVDEIVLVDDGSTDDTVAYVRGCEDPRIRVVEHGEARGVAAARNTAMRESRGEWLLWGEDDVLFPVDYAEVLLDVAAREEAQIVGAPWLHIGDPSSAEKVWRQAREHPAAAIGLDSVGDVPATTIATPFIPARALVSRRVFDAGVRYDSAYRGNAYREETSFFVEAARHGFRVVLTPETYTVQAGLFGGGHARRARLRYEYWALRNTGRFLRLHGRWLADHGYIDGPVRELARFAYGRVAIAVRGRVRRLRGR